MEPLTTAAVALGTVVGTKVLEKTGENVGQVLWDKGAKLLESLKQESPDTVTAIERAPEQPLDYGEAVLEIESAAKNNSEIARTMEELAAAGNANPHPKFQEIFGKIEEALRSQQPSIYNDNKAKLQEKGIINQGTIHRQDVSF
ncbi:MAG: hypothetical protein SXA11_14550 [Cyanobacteriota bacterium]|nr:hypothetical protein [Cyanobacteriota bacterium]